MVGHLLVMPRLAVEAVQAEGALGAVARKEKPDEKRCLPNLIRTAMAF
jgi:hypothetical protein